MTWAHRCDFHALLHEYDDFCVPVRTVLQLAAQERTHQFDMLSGPRLERVVAHGRIAFVGDAAHALLGNFGSGAGFAFEDVYSLSRTLEWAWSRSRPLADALALFNSIRSPYYGHLYELIDEFATIKAALREENLSVDEEIAERVRRVSQASQSWMHHHRIDEVVEAALKAADTARLQTI